MQVAKCVNEQNVDVGREEQEILHKRGDHVPWVEVEDRGDEIEAVCSLRQREREGAYQEGQCHLNECAIGKERFVVFPPGEGVRHGLIDCPAGTVEQEALAYGKE